MNNEEFNIVLQKSFKTYLETCSRSNKKLIILHGSIAEDLNNKLGKEYTIKSLGFNEGKEVKILGRYMDKKVDISILKNNKFLSGIAVKFVMSNYFQNSNNYFENMLGETANIRCNNVAYFQILIIPKKLPYFKNDGTISKVEEISSHHLEKYIKLSEDDINEFLHTPTKTLLCLLDMPNFDRNIINNKEKWIEFLLKSPEIKINLCKDSYTFKDSVIYNDYSKFIDKVVNYIKFIEN